MKIKLNGIQETLLIPLWSRSKLSKQHGQILVDSMATDIIDKIQYDFSKIDSKIPDYIHIMNFVRAKMFDNTINEFLISHPEAVIVNLGAGLDTTFYRVDNGLLKWYDIDLPDVIDLRKKLIPDTERSYCIKESIFDMQWIKYLNNIRGGGVLFISGGVLEYFNKDTVKQFLICCADKFPDSEIVFNTTRMNMIGSIFMKITFNRIGMWTVTPSKLGLINEKTFQKWDKRLVLLENYPLFSRIKMDDNFDRKTANTLKFYDKLKIFNILHLYFSN